MQTALKVSAVAAAFAAAAIPGAIIASQSSVPASATPPAQVKTHVKPDRSSWSALKTPGRASWRVEKTRSSWSGQRNTLVRSSWSGQKNVKVNYIVKPAGRKQT